MASYLITGVARGIGFEFIRQLSADSSNTVIGFVRDKKVADEKVAKEIGKRENLHIIEADLTDYRALKKAVPEVERLTDGKLDYIIENAAFIGNYGALLPLDRLGDNPEKLGDDLLQHFNTNVIGNIHLINLFIPLVLKGKVKKVIHITTGLADAEMAAEYDISVAAPYAISKGAMNLAIAKFSALYRKDGVLFASVAPGYVDTGNFTREKSEEELANEMDLGGKFMKYAPHIKGMITSEESVNLVRDVIDRASIETGYAGAFVSQFGNKRWL